jgi:CopG family nickel-responsive transcriptional regulator
MSNLERIGVSLDKMLLDQFDQWLFQKQYPNRSEAIRDLIRSNLAQEELTSPSAKAVAAILLVYDHHSMKLSQRLVEIQHDHLIQTISAQHVHLDHDNCLEVIILKGKAAKLQQIADRITSLKGVKLSRINIVPTGEKLT